MKYANVKISWKHFWAKKKQRQPDRVINSAIATDLLLPHSVIKASRKIESPSYRNVPVEPNFHGIGLENGGAIVNRVVPSFDN